ncbi:hypothetical protein MKX03_033985 [Papaver bracteatum]|nr:hypothetical protein MKX03_033985 [Papaver bracteatum]
MATSSSSSSSFLIKPSTVITPSTNVRHQNVNFFSPKPFPLLNRNGSSTRLFAASKKKTEEIISAVKQVQEERKPLQEDEEEVEEDLPWIQEKALDVVEFTGSVTQALPGPRVGQSKLPWLLAVPLGYLGITFVIAFVKTVQKFNSPKEKRRKLVNKNAFLCISIDELFQKGRDAVEPSSLKELMQKTGFGMEEILRKYVRYAMNEKPFNPDMVADLIQLRKASMLNDNEVAEILNEISRRIVRDKGPVVMDISGYSEKGFKRKLAVQALFGKIFYLSELPEFGSRESSLIIKDIFGVTDEDAITLRTHTLSEAGDVESLQKMLGNSNPEEPNEGSSVASDD